MNADSIWLQSETQSYSFTHVFDLANQLPSFNKGRVVWFYSDVTIHELAQILALWIKGAVLVPVHREWKSEVIQRLVLLTGATPWNEFEGLENYPHFESLVAFIQTSGTDSFPKIVPISKSMVEAATQTTAHFFDIHPGDVWFLNLPIHHIGGLSILLRAYYLRYTVFIPDKKEKKSYKQAIKLGYTQFASLVPTQLKSLLDENILPHPSFKQILLGGGPVTKSVLQSALSVGYSVVYSFGMTETAAQFTGKWFQAYSLIDSVSVGKTVAPNQFRITREHPPYQTASEGLLWVSGPQVFANYKSGEEVLRDGDWFCTGDFARLTTDGELEVLMRRTDRIVSGGENINPIEVECILDSYPEINEALVTGKLDEVWGEKLVCLYIGDIKDESTLKSWLKERLESYKIPKEFIKVDQLPRVSISKLDRKTAKKWVNEDKSS